MAECRVYPTGEGAVVAYTGIITPTICRGQRKRLGPRSPYRWSYRWSNNTSAVHCLRNILKLLVGPGEVPRRSDFNHLQCQTSLTALTGAKGIFLCCQTSTVTTPNANVYEPSLPFGDCNNDRIEPSLSFLSSSAFFCSSNDSFGKFISWLENFTFVSIALRAFWYLSSI